jgi:hypothetical protein
MSKRRALAGCYVVCGLIISLMGQLSLNLVANSIPPAAVSNPVRATFIVVALLGTAGLAYLDRGLFTRSTEFTEKLRELYRESGFAERKDLVAATRRLLLPRPPEKLASLVEGVLEGREAPRWDVAKAIVEACTQQAQRTGRHLPAELADLTSWQQRHDGQYQKRVQWLPRLAVAASLAAVLTTATISAAGVGGVNAATTPAASSASPSQRTVPTASVAMTPSLASPASSKPGDRVAAPGTATPLKDTALPSATPTLSAKAAACAALVIAARNDASAIQSLHNAVVVDDPQGKILSTFTSDISALYDAAVKAVDEMNSQIPHYLNTDGKLPQDLDFQHRTEIMLSTDLPALRDGLIHGTNTSAYEAWNEQTRYADFARKIGANTDCAW